MESGKDLRFESDENGMIGLNPVNRYLLALSPGTNEIGLLVEATSRYCGFPDLQVQLALTPEQAMKLGTQLVELAGEREFDL